MDHLRMRETSRLGRYFRVMDTRRIWRKAFQRDGWPEWMTGLILSIIDGLDLHWLWSDIVNEHDAAMYVNDLKTKERLKDSTFDVSSVTVSIHLPAIHEFARDKSTIAWLSWLTEVIIFFFLLISIYEQICNGLRDNHRVTSNVSVYSHRFVFQLTFLMRFSLTSK